MRTLADLPAPLQDPDAGLVHLFDLEVEKLEIQLTGAAAWFDRQTGQFKDLKFCLFDYPMKLRSQTFWLINPIRDVLDPWASLIAPTRNGHWPADFQEDTYTFERTGHGVGTLLFTIGFVQYLPEPPPICALMSAHERLKLASRPDVLHLRTSRPGAAA